MFDRIAKSAHLQPAGILLTHTIQRDLHTARSSNNPTDPPYSALYFIQLVSQAPFDMHLKPMVKRPRRRPLYMQQFPDLKKPPMLVAYQTL